MRSDEQRRGPRAASLGPTRLARYLNTVSALAGGLMFVAPLVYFVLPVQLGINYVVPAAISQRPLVPAGMVGSTIAAKVVAAARLWVEFGLVWFAARYFARTMEMKAVQQAAAAQAEAAPSEAQ